jgi:hypothetical protein
MHKYLNGIHVIDHLSEHVSHRAFMAPHLIPSALENPCFHHLLRIVNVPDICGIVYVIILWYHGLCTF